jgi:hypothetical protein
MYAGEHQYPAKTPKFLLRKLPGSNWRTLHLIW